MKSHLLSVSLSLAGLLGLSACHEAPPHMAATPQPIVQNNQLRFPSEHPQLALLVASHHNHPRNCRMAVC